jgi:hypothetical protein
VGKTVTTESPVFFTTILTAAAMVTATAVMRVAGLFCRFGTLHTVGLSLMLWLMVIYFEQGH